MTELSGLRPIDLLIGLCSSWPILYISCFAHEVGHVVMGRAGGFIVASFGMGIGRPWAVLRRGQIRIFFCSQKPFQGIAFCIHPRFYPPRANMVLMLAGGLIANGLLALFALALCRWLPWGSAVWITAFCVNAALFVGSVLPYRYRVGTVVLRSDGQQILSVARDRVISSPAPVVIQTLEGLRGLWESIGDQIFLRLYLLGGASARLMLGDLERAESLLADAKSSGASDIPTLRARELLVEAALASVTGRSAPALQALDEAESLLRATGDDGGLALVALARAGAHIRQHDTAAALALLEALSRDPRIERNPELRGVLLEVRLECCAARADAAGAQEALARYEASPGRQHSVTRDFSVYKAMAVLHAAREDWPQAETAYRKGANALNALLASCSAADERRRFLECQSSFLDGARRCFSALNKPQDADRLVEPMLSPAEMERRLSEVYRQRQRRLARVAIVIAAVDACCILAALAASRMVGGENGRFLDGLAGVFTLFTIPLIGYLVFYATIGRSAPRLGLIAGAIFLVLASLPVLILLVMILVLVFLAASSALAE